MLSSMKGFKGDAPDQGVHVPFEGCPLATASLNSLGLMQSGRQKTAGTRCYDIRLVAVLSWEPSKYECPDRYSTPLANVADRRPAAWPCGFAWVLTDHLWGRATCQIRLVAVLSWEPSKYECPDRYSTPLANVADRRPAAWPCGFAWVLTDHLWGRATCQNQCTHLS